MLSSELPNNMRSPLSVGSELLTQQLLTGHISALVQSDLSFGDIFLLCLLRLTRLL